MNRPTDEESDEAVMLRVKDGEVGGLDALFRRHSGALFGFCYRLSGDAGLAEDVVQEVFWRILRYRDSFDARRRFRPWIYRIARNLVADQWRAQRREAELGLEGEEPVDRASLTALQHCVVSDEQERLRQALAMLPAEQREVLVLARFEGLSFREIGEVLGCREGTAKVRAFRALRALRASYLELEKGGFSE